MIIIKLEKININLITPYKKNPRKNDEVVESVVKSIKQCEYIAPIILDENNIILAGHTRFKALKKLNYEEVECIIKAGLTEEQKKKYRLLDNKTNELAEWDYDILTDELTGLDFEDLNIDWGIDGLYDLEAQEEKEVVEDAFNEELPKNANAKLGDIYQLGRHMLMCGDCTKIEDIEALLGVNKVDLVFTDPPYGINIVKKNSISMDSSIKFRGTIGCDGIAKAKKYIPIANDDSTEVAKMFYDNCIKLNIKNYILFGGNYFTDFLPVSKCWIVWNKERSGNFADGELAWSSFDKSIKIYDWIWNGMTRQGDRKTELKERVHPTQKPVGLIGEILKDFSEEGSNVLDCFGGSGSTLIACEQINRNCFMMELEPLYVDIIIKRWENFTGEKAKLLT